MADLITALAPFVPLMQTILWIIVIGTGTGLFFKQCRGILDAVRNRIERGSSLKAGPIELGEDLRELDYVEPKLPEQDPTIALPAPEDKEHNWATERNKIYEHSRGVFLAHVIEPSAEPGQLYDIFVYLVRHKSTSFEDISHAEFFFGHYWGNEVFSENFKDGLIGVSTSAYGPFLCTCRVTFADGYVAMVHRYIDFEMGRVFDGPPNNSLQRTRPRALAKRSRPAARR